MKPILKTSNRYFQFYYWDTSHDIFTYSYVFKRFRKALFIELILGHLFNRNDIVFVKELDLVCHETENEAIFYSGASGKIIEAFRIGR